MNPTNSLRSTWRLISSHRKESFFIWLSDLFFFSCFAASHYFIIKMIPHIQELNEMIAQNADAISPVVMQQAGPAFPMAAFQSAFSAILTNVAWFIATIFASWVLVQGFSWWRTHKLLGHKVGLVPYLKRFFAISTAWLAVVALLSFIAIRVSMYIAVASLTGLPQWIGPAFIGGIIALLSYVAIAAYATSAEHGLKYVAQHLWKEMKKRVPVFIVGTLLMVSVFSLTAMLNSFNEMLSLAGILLLIIPASVFSRILVAR